MLDRGGEHEQREQNRTTKELGQTIYIDLAHGERHYSDCECSRYEREYLPLQFFLNSCEGSQIRLPVEPVCGAGAWNHGQGKDTLEEEGENTGQTQVPEINDQDSQPMNQIEWRIEQVPRATPQPLEETRGQDSGLRTTAWETAAVVDLSMIEIPMKCSEGRTRAERNTTPKEFQKTMKETSTDTRLVTQSTWGTGRHGGSWNEE